jgi:Domain of unknown function (DUF427)
MTNNATRVFNLMVDLPMPLRSKNMGERACLEMNVTMEAGGPFRPATSTSPRTYCPYKGETAYFNVQGGQTTVPDGAWTVPGPLGEALESTANQRAGDAHA